MAAPLAGALLGSLGRLLGGAGARTAASVGARAGASAGARSGAAGASGQVARSSGRSTAEFVQTSVDVASAIFGSGGRGRGSDDVVEAEYVRGGRETSSAPQPGGGFGAALRDALSGIGGGASGGGMGGGGGGGGGSFGGGSGGGGGGGGGGDRIGEQIGRRIEGIVLNKIADFFVFTAATVAGRRRGARQDETRASVIQSLSPAGSQVFSEGKGVARRVVRNTGQALVSPNPFARARAVVDQAKLPFEMPFIIRRWGEELEKSHKHLVKFNAEIGVAYLQSEYRSIERNVRTGEQIGHTVRDRQESLDDLRDSVQPWQNRFEGVMNVAVARLADLGTVAIKIVELIPHVRALAWLIERIPGVGRPADANVNAAFRDLGATLARATMEQERDWRQNGQQFVPRNRRGP